MKEFSVALFILMAASLVAAEPTKHSTRTDFDVIQGTWNLVALEADGKQAPAKLVTAVKLIFKDDTLTFGTNSTRPQNQPASA